MDRIITILDFDGLISSLLDFIMFCFFILQSLQTHLIKKKKKSCAVHLASTQLFPDLGKPSSLFFVSLILPADALC